jgi:tissue inhibitor of metalloproteinase
VRRLLLAAALTFGMLVLTPSPSWACSCVTAKTPQQVNDAVTVASGTVDWTATDGQTRTYKVDFDAVYKGAAAASEKLSTNASEASCGAAALATGKRYLFFIEGKHPGTMRIGLCGGTTAYDDAVARQVQAVTGPPGKPLSTPTPTTTSDDTSSRTTVIALGAVGLLLVAAIGAFVVRRRG